MNRILTLCKYRAKNVHISLYKASFLHKNNGYDGLNLWAIYWFNSKSANFIIMQLLTMHLNDIICLSKDKIFRSLNSHSVFA